MEMDRAQQDMLLGEAYKSENSIFPDKITNASTAGNRASSEYVPN